MSEEEWNSDNGSGGEEDSTAHALLVADIDFIAKTKKQPKPSSGVRYSSMASGGVDLGALASLDRQVVRKEGYETMAEELNKWAGVVHKMRTARQITFPLQDQKVSIFDQDHTTQPLTKTTLQKKLFGLMNDAGLMKAKEESAEEKAVREALSLEEVKERNRDAWRLRVLRDKIGKKAHHRNRTKSKKFHRELKKDRLKQLAAELENLKKTDPSKAVEKLQELEDIRIEERKKALSKLQENARLHMELVQKLQKQQLDLQQQDEGSSASEESDEDDPTDAVTLETKVLIGIKSRVADLFNNDDSDGETGEQNELFDEDDNALEEFNKQKAAAEEAAQPKDECYALPGWGDWASLDCLISKKKMEKFTIKAPKKPPVKRCNFIYNEKADLHPGIRERMVKELPYPFKSVADWEASVRFPLSRAFIPETVHQKLIAPRVVRKAGHVIKPLDQTQLFNQPEIEHAVKRKMQMSSGDDQSDKNPPKKRVRRLVTFKKSIKKLSRNSVSR
ncbi:Small-subunit processome Utp14 [Trinorchestia longiramus]|nr:Small-subunit processome Utp14 [Trinorchestia longiramus]